jgi:anti-sigma28 factor (negative regulator of flagellin synthesis)
VKVTDRSTVVPLTETRSASEARPAPAAAPKGKPDRISLSEEAQRLLNKKAEQIRLIAQQIAEGSYSFDLDQLADAIVRKETL